MLLMNRFIFALLLLCSTPWALADEEPPQVQGQSHEGIYVADENTGDAHIIFPSIDTQDFTIEQWQEIAEGLWEKQQSEDYRVRVLLTGPTVDEAYETQRHLMELLERNKVLYEILYVPQDMAEDLGNEADRIYQELQRQGPVETGRLKWKHLARKPNVGDILIGTSMGAIASGVMWFFSGALDPGLAFLLSTVYALPIAGHTINLKFFDRVYKFALLGKRVGKRVRVLTEMSKRQLVNLFYAELFRVVSGPIGQASSAFTLQGQAEILAHVMAFGLGSVIFSSQRNRFFGHQPDKSKWVNFYNFLIMSPLIIMDIAGMYNFSFQVGTIEVHDTALYVLGTNTVLAGLLRWPKLREGLYRFSGRHVSLGQRLAEKTRAFCDRLLR